MHEDLFKGLFIVNLVVLEINGRQTRALKESTKVIDAISTNSVSLKIKTVELSQITDTLDRGNQVIGNVEIRKRRQAIETFHFLDTVLVDVEATQLRVGLQATDLAETVAFEVQSLQVRELLHASDLFEA